MYLWGTNYDWHKLILVMTAGAVLIFIFVVAIQRQSPTSRLVSEMKCQEACNAKEMVETDSGLDWCRCWVPEDRRTVVLWDNR